MSTVPFRDLAAEQAGLQDEMLTAMRRVVRDGRFILGPEVAAFEQEWAAYCGTRHAVGVGSGLAAIELMLRAYGIGPGHEVIVPAYTFIGTWLAVSAVGAVPLCVDVDPATYNIDPDAVSAAIGRRTSAILAVDLFGMPAAMNRLRDIADRHSLLLFEDAAQAHGAAYHGRRCGSLGDAAAFSFYPTKNLGALGDGGAVTTDSAEVADRVRRLRNYGLVGRYRPAEAGTNSRLDEVQAAVLRVKLRRLDDANSRRRETAMAYLDLLGDSGLGLPGFDDIGSEPSWHIFAIRHRERDYLRTRLASAGIDTQIYYECLPHRTGAFSSTVPWPATPVSDRLSATSLALPCHPGAAPAVPRVVTALLAALAETAQSHHNEHPHGEGGGDLMTRVFGSESDCAGR